MASEVSIVNAAFRLIGEPRISSLDDAVTAARIAKSSYDDYRDFVLMTHPWTFALKRDSLAASATAPEWEFDVAYPLPADCLFPVRVKNEDPRSGRWKQEGRNIVTDMEAPIPVLYVKQVTDPDEMTPQFRELLSTYLAWKWADEIRGSREKANELKDDYHDMLDEIRSLDSRQGTEDPIVVNAWLEARLGRSTAQEDLAFLFTPGTF